MDALISALVIGSGLVMLALRCCATLIINEARDQMLIGAATVKAQFDTWHRATVILNMLGILYLIIAACMLLFR